VGGVGVNDSSGRGIDQGGVDHHEEVVVLPTAGFRQHRAAQDLTVRDAQLCRGLVQLPLPVIHVALAQRLAGFRLDQPQPRLVLVVAVEVREPLC